MKPLARWTGLLGGAALGLVATASLGADPPAPATVTPESAPAPATATPESGPAPLTLESALPPARATPESAPAPAGTSAEDLEPTEPPPLTPTSPALHLSPDLAHPDDWTVGGDLGFGPLVPRGKDLLRVDLHARFGYRLSSGRLFLVPEVSLGFVEVAETISGVGFHSEQVWVGAGGQVGARFWRFEPSLFVHGYIWFTGPNGDLALDGGPALDFRITRSISAGAHFAWTVAHDARGVTASFVDYGTLGIQVNVMR